jgi:hypothetical protein
MELPSINSYVVSQIDKIIMFNSNNFMAYDEIPIKLLKAETREPNQVIAMQTSKNDEFVAIISGRILIMNE